MQFTSTLPSADAAINDALLAMQKGDRMATALAAQRAVQHDPGKLQAWWIWGMAAIEMWRFGEAEQALAEGLKRVPEGHPIRIRFLTQRARALVQLGRYAEACDQVREAVGVGVEDTDTLHLLGMSLARSSREAEALPLLQQAAAQTPDNMGLWFSLGEVQLFLGQLEAAEASFEKAIACGPQTAAHLAIARLKRQTPEHNHIERLKALSVTAPIDQARLGYALFKELDDIGQTAEAWDWLQKGARAAHEDTDTPGNPAWSAKEERETVVAWQTHFPPERFAGLPPRPRYGPRRIFIVGLPRSGTTLLERILAAHSQVQAPGELQIFPVATNMLANAGTPALLDAATIAAAAQLHPQAFTDFYDRETAYLDDGRAYMIDKLPNNSDYIGLIRLAYPDAIIIHMRREPMDALFGSYKLHFARRWSFDLDDLADHYANYRALMAHWQACLGADLIDMSLERLIAEPESQIRRLLDACGLPFEAACLSPHETKGAVASASTTQVRKPINAEGVDAWRRYKDQLEPLRARLEDMGFVDTNGKAK